MLLSGLNEERSAIQSAFTNNDYELMLEKVHRLHGATKYVGVPQLRQATHSVETFIKKSQLEELEDATLNLLSQIDQLTEWRDQNHPIKS